MANGNLIGPLPEKHVASDTKTKSLDRKYKSPRAQMFEKINKTEQHYLQELRQPFCRRSARDAFIAAQLGRWAREGASACADNTPRERISEEWVEVPDFDLEEFAKDDYFIKLGDKPRMENKLIDGIKVAVETGKYVTYQGKRGFKVDILNMYDPSQVMNKAMGRNPAPMPKPKTQENSQGKRQPVTKEKTTDNKNPENK